MTTAKEFWRRMIRAHMEMASWPEWQRVAARGSFGSLKAPEDCRRKDCPCHKIRELGENFRAEVQSLIDAFFEENNHG